MVSFRTIAFFKNPPGENHSNFASLDHSDSSAGDAERTGSKML